MMTRVTVGESAASKKYRMTLAVDKQLVSPPPVDNRALEPFPVKLADPPQPPRPLMKRPTPPPRQLDWEDRGWVWRMRHHLHMYNHGRMARKADRALQEKRDYTRDAKRYEADKERYNQEDREYRRKMAEYPNIMVTPPPPSKATLAELSDYDKAVVGLRKQIRELGKKREAQFNFVMETQAACTDSYNRAMILLNTPGSETLAALKAKDYHNATKELDRAQTKYNALSDEEQRIANMLERAIDTEFQRGVDENMGVVSEKIADDLEEIRNLQQDLRTREVPESVMQDAAQSNKDLADVLKEMQDKIKNKTRQDLGMDSPQSYPAQRDMMQPLLN